METDKIKERERITKLNAKSICEIEDERCLALLDYYASLDPNGKCTAEELKKLADQNEIDKILNAL